MSIAVITERVAETSPRLKARIAGALYLTGLGQLFVQAVLGKLVVAGDASTTAHNILAQQTLYRLALAADIVTFPCYVAVTVLYLDLFTPVNRTIALLATFFGLAGCVMGAVNDFFLLGPLAILSGTHTVTAPDSAQAQAALLLDVRAQGANIVLVAFGFHVILVGYLIVKSTFLPRFLGWWLMLAGVCYLINCFANFLSPELAARLSPYILLPGAVEIVLALWLLIMGVNVQQWKKQAGAAEVPQEQYR